MHRIAYQLKKPAMCFQATIFLAFQNMNRQKGLVKSNPVIKELWTFGKYLLGQFFNMIAKNDKLPLETLFWTKLGDCESIQEGSYSNHSVKRSALWDEDNDDELRQVLILFDFLVIKDYLAMRRSREISGERTTK